MTKFVLVNRTYFNSERITAFEWVDGKLNIFDGNNEPFSFPDKERKLYCSLCHDLCLNVLEEE